MRGDSVPSRECVAVLSTRVARLSVVLLVTGLLAGLLTAPPLFAQIPKVDLIVSYLDRPPYYYTEDAVPKGILIDRVKEILQTAGLTASFREMPAGRVLHNIEHNVEPQCSIGWFKNAERQQFARFTLPIWTDSSWMVLTSSSQKELVGQHSRFADLLQDQNLTWVSISGFSYGKYIDDLKARLAPGIIEISGNQLVLPQLIQKGRASYMIIAREEFLPLLQSAGLLEQDFNLLPMQDAPKGSERHLMCSHAVSPATIERLNRAILAKNSADHQT